MDIKSYEVPAEKLSWQCDLSGFDFDCTKELAPLGEFIGQNRAIRAIEFGLSMELDGYNIYVAGLTGTGKTSAVMSHIKKLVEKKQLEDHKLCDWCYLYNFADPDRPRLISFPKGKGKAFRDQVSNLLQKWCVNSIMPSQRFVLWYGYIKNRMVSHAACCGPG